MSHITHVRVPAYENLSLEQIFSHFDDNAVVYKYLPSGNEMRKVPKVWICNVLATVAGEPFIAWVSQQINQRNATVIQEKQLAIEMDEEVAAAFRTSTAVSRK